MYINKKSPVPVYFQLRNSIMERIKNGEYKLGSLIPSERELSEQLGISRMTVRQALSLLVNEGVLYREKGRGTFVSKIVFEQKNIMSFSEMVRKKGAKPKTEILYFKEVKSPPDISIQLDMEDNEKIYNLKRLRFADNNPVAIEEVFIPVSYCPNMVKDDLSGSLYSLLQDKYSYTISFMDNRIQAVLPSQEEKSLLHIAGNTPLLSINGVNYTEKGLKLFFEKSIYRSDEYEYSVRVHLRKE